MILWAWGQWAWDGGHRTVGMGLSSSPEVQHCGVTFQWPQLETVSGEEGRPLFPTPRAFLKTAVRNLLLCAGPLTLRA